MGAKAPLPSNLVLKIYAGLSMGHIYLSHPMGFPLHDYNINMDDNSIKIITFMKVQV